jgi:EpsI family protein
MAFARFQRWVPALVLSAGCSLLLVSGRQRRMPLIRPLSELPTQILGFNGRDIVISPEERAVAGMSTYVLRQFDKADAAFSVYVGYYESQTQGRSIHSPKNCLPGAGWEPMSSGVTSVPVTGRPVNVNRYILGKGNATALVYYWYEGRGRVASNEYVVKWDLLRDEALRGRSEEALVRIVVPFKGGVADADRLATQVAVVLIPEVERRLPAFSGRAITSQ